jgi:uncharacterized protein
MAIDAGFDKRMMFGSDRITWPDVIEPQSRLLDEAPFLSEGAEARYHLPQHCARFHVEISATAPDVAINRHCR